MRMSNAKVPAAIRAREVFDNNGSTLLGARKFRGWGHLPEQWREAYDTDRIAYWVYSYDTPIAWVHQDGGIEMPEARYSKVTLHHQKIVAEALGLKVNPIDWPLARPAMVTR